MKIVTQGNKESRIVYGSDVLAMTESVATFSALLKQRYRWKMGCLQNLFKYRQLFASTTGKYSIGLSWYRIPMAYFGEIILLLEPFAIAFIVYLTIKTGNPSFIVGAYMAITLYLLWNVWPDEHMSFDRKIKMSFYSPIMYFLFYIMNLVQLVAIIRCIFNPRQVFRVKGSGSTWISPERSGSNQVQFN
jgi:biofilm PGA synthesis N-glycosyltransferase PgaC